MLPSPKFQIYEAIVPSESVEPEPSKVAVSGEVPLVGVAVITADGALLMMIGADTTMGVLAELVNPLLSVTVRVAV